MINKDPSLDSDKAKIVALATQLEQLLQKNISSYATAASSSFPCNQGPTGSNAASCKSNVEAWRMKETLGDKVQRDGKWYY